MADRYQNIPVKYVESRDGTQLIPINKTTFYPEIPFSINDEYAISPAGDRWTLLANDYYKDVTLWWVIKIANPNVEGNSLYIKPGQQIRIPINPSPILERYNDLNSI